MAPRNTVQAGDYHTGSTWDGGTVPDPTDTVTIGHAVTASAPITQGHSPATDDAVQAILIQSSGSLSVAANLEVRVRGDFKWGTSPPVFADGCTLTFDATQSASPGTTVYKGLCGILNGDDGALVMNGTAGNRCKIRSDTTGGAANALFKRGAQVHCPTFQLYYTDLEDLGTAADRMMEIYRTTASPTMVDTIFDHCLFRRCGQLSSVTNMHVEAGLRIEYCTFRDPLNTSFPINFIWGSAPVATRKFNHNCVQTGQTWIAGPGPALEANDNVFGRKLFNNNFGPCTSFARNILTHNETGSCFCPAGAENFIFIHLYEGQNPHGIQVGGGQSGNYALRDFIIDPAALNISGDSGDMIIVTQTGSTTVVTLEHVLVLPADSQKRVGTVTSQLGGSLISIENRHFTAIGGFRVGETYNGHAGQLNVAEDCIHWDFDGQDRYWQIQDLNGPGGVLDSVTPAGCRNNVYWMLNSGSNGKAYHNLNGSASYGDTDVEDNPNFFDVRRNAATFDKSLGGVGTRQNCVDQFMLKNEPGYDPRYNYDDLKYHIQEGFRPRNRRLQNNGLTGKTQGALEVSRRRNLHLMGAG